MWSGAAPIAGAENYGFNNPIFSTSALLRSKVSWANYKYPAEVMYVGGMSYLANAKSDETVFHGILYVRIITAPVCLRAERNNTPESKGRRRAVSLVRAISHAVTFATQLIIQMNPRGAK